MPPKKSNKGFSTKKRNKTISVYIASSELRPDVLACPPSLPSSIERRMVNQQDLYTIKMVSDLTATSDGSGNLVATYGNLPSLGSNWSSAAAFFDEYRVLATTLEFRPNWFASGATTVVLAPVTTVIDYDSSAALTGYTLAAQYSSVKEFRGMVPWKRTALMSGSADSGFISTASPGSTFWIKIWSAGNPVSTALGRYVFVMYVQFRGKGI